MNDNRCDESSRLFDLLNVSISLFFEQESQVTNNDWVLWCLMYNTYMYLLCCHLQVFSNSSSYVFLEKKMIFPALVPNPKAHSEYVPRRLTMNE